MADRVAVAERGEHHDRRAVGRSYGPVLPGLSIRRGSAGWRTREHVDRWRNVAFRRANQPGIGSRTVWAGVRSSCRNISRYFLSITGRA